MQDKEFKREHNVKCTKANTIQRPKCTRCQCVMQRMYIRRLYMWCIAVQESTKDRLCCSFNMSKFLVFFLTGKEEVSSANNCFWLFHISLRLSSHLSTLSFPLSFPSILKAYMCTQRCDAGAYNKATVAQARTAEQTKLHVRSNFISNTFAQSN